MHTDDLVASTWHAQRPHLVDLAFRMLGDIGAAEDVVQEAFVKLFQARIHEIEDPRGWLTVVTSRLCFDLMKSARVRREQAHDALEIGSRSDLTGVDPADRITLDDNIRLALVVVMERLTPAERVAFVLHDIFRAPFEVVAETMGRSSAGCRQLARRARKKIQQANGAGLEMTTTVAHQEIPDRFIAACATGAFDDLVALLDPGAAGTIDGRPGSIVVGGRRVARNLIRFWGGPRATLVSHTVGGQLALLGFVDRELAGLLLLTVADDRVTKIHVVADPTVLALVRSHLGPLAPSL